MSIIGAASGHASGHKPGGAEELNSGVADLSTPKQGDGSADATADWEPIFGDMSPLENPPLLRSEEHSTVNMPWDATTPAAAASFTPQTQDAGHNADRFRLEHNLKRKRSSFEVDVEASPRIGQPTERSDALETFQKHFGAVVEDSGNEDRHLSDMSVPMVLPHSKVFPIQVGDELFRLSGASISSDAPSYFSRFFQAQERTSWSKDDGARGEVKTLYIDRDPVIFKDIVLHLQGYHIQPKDGTHFARLFADVQFYGLPRLAAQLFSADYFVRIGDTDFQISRDILEGPGNTPNYFTLGFTACFSRPDDVFPGLSQEALLRPPSIRPSAILTRSATTFAELLHILKGYSVQIRNEEHRNELLRDARYYHLKGLEQQLLSCAISYNLARKCSEIVIRLEDMRQSGLAFLSDSGRDVASSEASSENLFSSTPLLPGWAYYQRPYVDSEAHALIVEIVGDEACQLSISGGRTSQLRTGRATFFQQTLQRLSSLFSTLANKMNLPVFLPLGLWLERGGGMSGLPATPSRTGMSEDRVKVCIGADADVRVDGTAWKGYSLAIATHASAETEAAQDEACSAEEWIVTKAQWRIRVTQIPASASPAGRSDAEVTLHAVKLEAYRCERARNQARGFLR